MTKTKVIEVFDIEVKIKGLDNNSYISLTDIARYKNPDEPKDVVKNWLRSKNTIEFLGLWEKLHNPSFKGVEFDTFRNQAGSNTNTIYIEENIPAQERLLLLNKIAIDQLKVLTNSTINLPYKEKK